MASQVPPKRGEAYNFEVALTSQSDTNVFQTSVTLAAGDVLVSKDGGATSNISSLPTEIGSTGILKVTLTAAEMTADRVAVLFHDQTGDEWADLLVTIQTVTDNQIDDLATATDLATVDSNIDAILLDTGTDGVKVADGAITADKIAADAITSSELATSAAQEIADEVLKRGVSNVEATADAHSLAAIILATLESVLSGSTWTIKKTDGTTFTTKTVTTDANADPIVSVT